MTERPKGFRYLMLHNPEKLAQIARKGGTKAQAGPNAKHWSTDEARAHGRRGAAVRWPRKKGAA